MTLLGAMDTTIPQHDIRTPVRPRLFSVHLAGSHNEEATTGLVEALEIAKKALHDRGYTVTYDGSTWHYEEARDVVRRPWYRRLLAWLRRLR